MNDTTDNGMFIIAFGGCALSGALIGFILGLLVS